MLKLNLLPNELIWKFVFYLSPTDVYKLNLVSNIFYSLRITKINIPYCLSNNFGIFNQKDNNLIVDYIKSKKYNFTEYLDDILNSIYRDQIIYRKRVFFKKYMISYKLNVSMLSKITKLTSIGNARKLEFALPNKTRDYKYCHRIYRVPFYIFMRIKNNNNLKALIY